MWSNNLDYLYELYFAFQAYSTVALQKLTRNKIDKGYGRKIYLDDENYCHVFVKGIRSLSAIVGSGTPNLPQFETRLVCDG